MPRTGAPMAQTNNMGWQAWDAYETDAEARRRALPWRTRYSWRGMILIALLASVVGAIIWTNHH